MSTRRPPVIPEIAKAYQNDPRTQLALAAMKAGTSQAPVAQGNYAYMDGIARALQGAIGGYTDRKQQDQYGADEAKKVAAMNAQGVSGLAPPAPQAPDEKSMIAQQAAAALGAPAPQAPPAAMGAPSAIPPVPAMTPPVTGGAQGRRPFGPASASGASTGLAPPVAETVPDMPAVLSRPDAPEAVGATRSKTLNEAYRLMSTGDRYDYDQAQEMLKAGLGDQTRLDESFAERRQRLADMSYQSDLGQYADSQSQDRRAKIGERSDAQNRNFQSGESFKGREFQAGESGKGRTFQHDEGVLERNFQGNQNALNRASTMEVARTRASGTGGGSTELNDEERAAISKAVGDGRIDLKGITKFQAKVVAQALVDNPDLDGIALHATATLAANPAAQQKAMLASALPEVLGNVRDAGRKLKFSDFAFAGALQSFAKGQLNDPDFAEYMTQRNDAMQTLAQVMSGVGATDMRTKMEAEAAPKSMSPRAWDAWYRGQIKALQPRIKMYEARRLLPKGTADTVAPSGGGGAPTSGWGKATVVGR